MTDSAEPKDRRINLVVSPSELDAIDEYWHRERLTSRSEAIRKLLKLGLEAAKRGHEKQTVKCK